LLQTLEGLCQHLKLVVHQDNYEYLNYIGDYLLTRR
jgi:hypothetical protein